jgi:DNA-binding SARP family transcriptional activator
MAKVRLAFLGPPSIELDGNPVHLDTRKAIALMAYLSVIGKPVSREALVNLLWSRYGRAEGHAALRRTLSTLRIALGREVIDAEREAVSLPELPDIWIDLSRFRESLALSMSHAHGQPAICRQCLPVLSEAAKLYRGDFLLGFTLKDSVEFDDWQFFTTEKYRLEAVQVLDRLALCSAAAGDFRSAIGHAHERLGLEPAQGRIGGNRGNIIALVDAGRARCDAGGRGTPLAGHSHDSGLQQLGRFE